MTVENLDVCVTAFFKMVSELDLVKIAEGDVMAIFQESVSKILHINPGMHEDRLKYMIHLALSDKVIAKEEISFIYDFGRNLVLSEMEIASFIAEAIQECYDPSLDAIC